MELKLVNNLKTGGTDYYLLIVPYGIETQFQPPYSPPPQAFNCTLWN